MAKVQFSVIAEPGTLARIDAARAHMAAETQLTVSRAAMVRLLIERGLATFERDAATSAA